MNKKMLTSALALMLPVSVFAVTCPSTAEVTNAIQNAEPLQQVAIKANGVDASWYSLGKYTPKSTASHLQVVQINNKANPQQTSCKYTLSSNKGDEQMLLFLSPTEYNFVKTANSNGGVWNSDGSACFIKNDDSASCAFTLDK